MGARKWINDEADILLKDIGEAWKGPDAMVKKKGVQGGGASKCEV